MYKQQDLSFAAQGLQTAGRHFLILLQPATSQPTPSRLTFRGLSTIKQATWGSWLLKPAATMPR
jgi:hypothetical protein